MQESISNHTTTGPIHLPTDGRPAEVQVTVDLLL